MLELAPNQGKNERGEWKHWLTYYQTSPYALQAVSHYHVHPHSPAGLALDLQESCYLNYVLLPWIWRGRPNVDTFDSLYHLGAFATLPREWRAWWFWRGHLIQPETDWVLSTGVSEAAISAAIHRRSENAYIGLGEDRAQAVQVR